MEILLVILGAVILFTILGKPKVDKQKEQYTKDCKVSNKQVTHNPNSWAVSFALAIATMIGMLIAIGVIGQMGLLPLPTN